MKTIVVLLLSCLLIVSCSKRDNSSDGRQEAFAQASIIEKEQKPDVSYVFDIDSFKYLDEFPRTIAGIKALYPDEPFEETMFETNGRSIPPGEYGYILRTSNVRFDFYGDTYEEARLYIVDIFNSYYQCKPIQVIGMDVEGLERLSGRKLDDDKKIAIYTELDAGLIIKTKDNIVQSYTIIGPFN